MNTQIIRRKDFDNFWLTTCSFQLGEGRWGNCLYIHFDKAKFPNIDYPKIIDTTIFDRPVKRYEYEECLLARDLDWHGGCTFYEETYLPDKDKTFVKIGCDYSHYMDDYYMAKDSGEMILSVDGESLAKEFIEKFVKEIK